MACAILERQRRRDLSTRRECVYREHISALRARHSGQGAVDSGRRQPRHCPARISIRELDTGRGKRVSLSLKKTHRSLLGLFCLVSASLLHVFPLAFAQTTTDSPPTAVSTTDAPAPMPQQTVSQRPSPRPVAEAMTAPPTALPSVDVVSPPTGQPTDLTQPSPSPSDAPRPTVSPTVVPTITPRPTDLPSFSPTEYPSTQPSFSPSAEPTFSSEITARTVFNQRFQIGNQQEFNETEQGLFCANMEGYTDDFGGRDDGRVNTTCRVLSQRLQIIGGTRRSLLRSSNGQRGDHRDMGRRMQGVVFNQVEYGMFYSSNHTNVTTYPTLFQNYVNEDLDRLTTDLQNAGLLVTNSFLAFNNIATLNPTTVPTITPRPTSPTVAPSEVEVVPSMAPSPVFTRDPSLVPETAAPSVSPNAQPKPPTRNQGRTTTIAVSVVVTLAIVMFVLLMFYRRRRRKYERKFQVEAAASGAAATAARGSNAPNNRDMRIDTGQPLDDTMKNGGGKQSIVGMISPSDSLQSRDSLLSAGPSPLSDGSEREDDGTHNLADEFDQYKDQNLEKMRTGVEDNLSGFDGMMSQALTKVLIDDDQEDVDNDLLRWGGTGDSIEIEATALYEVTDWLKRNDGATLEERGKFMQETLDRMVASVRHGVMDPETGSRTIHECAALLGLQLATGITPNTLVVTGMPKWVQRNDLLAAFSEFGEIEDAAVAAERRGFGLVRFKYLRGVNAALSKFRTGEIVVQDVAVMIKVLRSDDVERSRTWEPGFPPPPLPGQNLSRHSSRAASPILK